MHGQASNRDAVMLGYSTPMQMLALQQVTSLQSAGNNIPLMLWTEDRLRQVIAQYTPVLYLHPDERYLPCSVDWYFERSQLWREEPVANVSPYLTNNQHAELHSDHLLQHLAAVGSCLEMPMQLSIQAFGVRPALLSFLWTVLRHLQSQADVIAMFATLADRNLLEVLANGIVMPRQKSNNIGNCDFFCCHVWRTNSPVTGVISIHVICSISTKHC